MSAQKRSQSSVLKPRSDAENSAPGGGLLVGRKRTASALEDAAGEERAAKQRVIET